MDRARRVRRCVNQVLPESPLSRASGSFGLSEIEGSNHRRLGSSEYSMHCHASGRHLQFVAQEMLR